MTNVAERVIEKNSMWALDPAHSSVEFAVKHMMITTVTGRFAKFDIDLGLDESHPEFSSVEARIDTASIDTRDDRRDAHLRSPDFLNAEQFPSLLFKSREVKSVAKERYRVVGDLTIQGVTREVELDTTFAGIGESPWGTTVARFSAVTRISRKDFGLTYNVELETGGVLVGDEVKISLEIEAIRQS